ncbi:unnamed protein product [Choristocarpus tenellus]
MASGSSKFIGSVMTYPHEVVRARMQDDRTIMSNRATGLWGTIHSIVSKEGPTALYTGFGVNVIRVVPSCVATFLTYEMLNRKLQGWV